MWCVFYNKHKIKTDNNAKAKGGRNERPLLPESYTLCEAE